MFYEKKVLDRLALPKDALLAAADWLEEQGDPAAQDVRAFVERCIELRNEVQARERKELFNLNYSFGMPTLRNPRVILENTDI